MKIPASDVNIPESRTKNDVLIDAKNGWKFFVRPHVVMGKYLLDGPLSSLFIKYNSNRAIIAGLVICVCAGICVTADINVIEDFLPSFFLFFFKTGACG